MIVDSPDPLIKASVLLELRLDRRVNETEIGVAVAEGIVTLTGRVDSEDEKAAAGQAAHRAVGVLDVANDIIVKLPFALGRTDADLAQAVRDALERADGVPAERIHSTVYDAVVTLTGMVDHEGAREAAERAVRRLAFVRRVANEIGVRDAVEDRLRVVP